MDPEDVAYEMFLSLQPEAIEAYKSYILNRTPAWLQEYMQELADEPIPPPDPNQAIVSANESITVYKSDATTPSGSVTMMIDENVVYGALLQTNQALVTSAQVADLVAASTVVMAEVTIDVTDGTLTLIAPVTDALVSNGDEIVVNDNAGTPNEKSPGIASVQSGSGELEKVTLAA